MFFTDFGVSRDWAELGHSTTSSPSITSPRYCAPETAAYEPRNTSADVWSLGCVFLEMCTVLSGEPLSHLNTHFRSEGSRSLLYHQNSKALDTWIIKLGSKKDSEYHILEPVTWIADHMLQRRAEDRWNVQELYDRIQHIDADSEVAYSFIGNCCIVENDEYSFESVNSSETDLSIPTSPDRREADVSLASLRETHVHNNEPVVNATDDETIDTDIVGQIRQRQTEIAQLQLLALYGRTRVRVPNKLNSEVTQSPELSRQEDPNVTPLMSVTDRLPPPDNIVTPFEYPLNSGDSSSQSIFDNGEVVSNFPADKFAIASKIFHEESSQDSAFLTHTH